jgi:hypothetical protein
VQSVLDVPVEELRGTALQHFAFAECLEYFLSCFHCFPFSSACVSVLICMAAPLWYNYFSLLEANSKNIEVWCSLLRITNTYSMLSPVLLYAVRGFFFGHMVGFWG